MNCLLIFLSLTGYPYIWANDHVDMVIDGKQYVCTEEGSIDKLDCTVTPKGSTDKYGQICELGTYAQTGYEKGVCAAVYQFGAAIAKNQCSGSSYSLTKYAADCAIWCKEQIN